MPDTLKYRAFLARSGADAAVADRIHRALEGWRIDPKLVDGAQTLSPIYCDRHEAVAENSEKLEPAAVAALDKAAALIVLASPQAAQSKYVNEAIWFFRWIHPERPVIPLIIGGTPGDPNLECFPPALGASSARAGNPNNAIVAALQTEEDFDRTIAKVVAALLVLPDTDIDRLIRQAPRTAGGNRGTADALRLDNNSNRQPRRNRVRIAVVLAALAVAGSAFFWQSSRQKAMLADATALADRYSAASPAEAAAPGVREGLTEAIFAIETGAPTEPRYAEALVMLRASQVKDAEQLLKALAEDRANRAAAETGAHTRAGNSEQAAATQAGSKDIRGAGIGNPGKNAATAYRHLAAIARVSDPARARDYCTQAVRLDPSDLKALYCQGWFQMAAGQFEEAECILSPRGRCGDTRDRRLGRHMGGTRPWQHPAVA